MARTAAPRGLSHFPIEHASEHALQHSPLAEFLPPRPVHASVPLQEFDPLPTFHPVDVDGDGAIEAWLYDLETRTAADSFLSIPGRDAEDFGFYVDHDGIGTTIVWTYSTQVVLLDEQPLSELTKGEFNSVLGSLSSDLNGLNYITNFESDDTLILLTRDGHFYAIGDVEPAGTEVNFTFLDVTDWHIF